MIRQTGLLAAAACLLLVIAWNFYAKAVLHDPYSAAVVRKTNRPSSGSSAREAESFSPGWTAAIHEKNLFSPARTFREPRPVITETLPPVEAPRRPEMSLRGVTLDAAGEYVAYIEIDRARPVPMRKGDKTSGIELIDISSRKAVLKWNGETMELSLDRIKTIDNPRAMK